MRHRGAVASRVNQPAEEAEHPVLKQASGQVGVVDIGLHDQSKPLFGRKTGDELSDLGRAQQADALAEMTDGRLDYDELPPSSRRRLIDLDKGLGQWRRQACRSEAFALYKLVVVDAGVNLAAACPLLSEGVGRNHH